MGVVLRTKLCKAILKSHILTGCDVTTKVGMKAAVLNSELQQYLEPFDKINEPPLESYDKAEYEYLVRVFQKNYKCANFNKLRYEVLQ